MLNAIAAIAFIVVIFTLEAAVIISGDVFAILFSRLYRTPPKSRLLMNLVIADLFELQEQETL